MKPVARLIFPDFDSVKPGVTFKATKPIFHIASMKLKFNKWNRQSQNNTLSAFFRTKSKFCFAKLLTWHPDIKLAEFRHFNENWKIKKFVCSHLKASDWWNKTENKSLKRTVDTPLVWLKKYKLIFLIFSVSNFFFKLRKNGDCWDVWLEVVRQFKSNKSCLTT
jgi:hypothetical protein